MLSRRLQKGIGVLASFASFTFLFWNDRIALRQPGSHRIGKTIVLHVFMYCANVQQKGCE